MLYRPGLNYASIRNNLATQDMEQYTTTPLLMLLVLTCFWEPQRFRGLGFRGNASTEPLWTLVLSSGFF